jgi:glycosyltransferase involved in cell wall biosynthesis
MKTGEPGRSFKVVRLITRLNIGGPAQQALLLTRELAVAYPTLLAAGIPAVDEGEMSDPAVRVHRLRLVRPLSPAEDAGAVASVRRILVRHRPQLVHTHMAKAGTVGRLAAVSLGRRRPRLVHTFHGHVLDGYFNPWLQRALVEVERRLARHTDLLIAVCPQVRDDLLSLGVGVQEQFRVVPLGLDLRRFTDPDQTRGLLRARLGLNDDTPLVGAAGRLVPVKDIDTLLAAVARLPGVHVALLGDGPSRKHLEERAVQLGLADRAHFLGWYADVPGAMRDFDVVALTSLNEGTPVAIIEALAAGRPVVATAVGGVGYVVKDGTTGLLSPKSDPVAFAEQLCRMLESRSDASAMAAAGQRDVTQRFSSERLVGDISDLYDELVAS